jgi:hypothetical protein
VGANDFLHQLQTLLRAHPAGLSEFELIKLLQAEGETGFEPACLKDNLSLFQSHFLLFHSLYCLADQLAAHPEWRLMINPLCIQLLPAARLNKSELAAPGALRSYYLDLDNLENTDAAAVEELLDQFWQRFLRNDERSAALDTLGLSDPVDWPTIKDTHRRLAMTHHPDRGGDEARLQEINAAMQILARAHGK